MICPKCGRTVPDGAPCPCGAPVLSSNPAVNLMKTLGSSPKFLTAAILYSVAVLFNLLASFGASDVISTLYYYGANYGFDPDVFYPMMSALEGSTVVSAVIGAIPSILMAVGMWLFYTTCRNTQSGNVSTVGLTICKVITIINLVLLCCVVLFLVAMVMIFIIAFAGMGEINYYSYSDGYYGATSAAFVITLLVIVSLIVAAVLALAIAYQVSILRAINRIKGSALNGAPDNRISRFLTGFMMVIGVLTCLGGLFSLIASPVAGIASLASGVCCVLMSLLLGEYRAKINSLKVMKESNNKTSGHTQSGQSKSAEKSSRTTTSRTSSASRGTASSQSSGSGRTSRSNNPEGHNQYTKKSQDNR